jgi:hypothetical protein
MNNIQQIFRDHGQAYLERFGDTIPRSHRKVIQAIQECRSGACGQHVFYCEDCAEQVRANSSCGNRHCPVCQNEKAAGWVHAQQLKLLPCTYYLATFTVPRELRLFARRHQRVVYKALFDCAAESLRTLMADTRFTGCEASGFFSVLHTWTQALLYHPHLHVVIPGGGLSEDRNSWTSPRGTCLVHVTPLSRLFRGKMKAALSRAGIPDQVPEDVWRRDWVVHCKRVGDGRHIMKYLGAYVFRVAVSDARIRSYNGTHVTVTGKKNQRKGRRFFTLDVMEFIRRYLQHVLPAGFMKIRHYGFLSPNFSVPLESIREMISVLHDVIRKILPDSRAQKKITHLCCPACRSVMKWLRFIPPPKYEWARM